MNVLVTGASGFIGSALRFKLLEDKRYVVRSAYRGAPKNGVGMFGGCDLSASTNWGVALAGCDAVIHTAARAHIVNDSVANPLAEFRRVNVDGTLALARQAISAGVHRFIFISSIGVNGSYSADVPFSEESIPSPHANYALSKLEAERGLVDLVAGTNMDLVIIRPPLVYAANAPGNFKRLLALIASGVPLPFGYIKNQRSMIALENLVDFIIRCLEHPAAANELFVISDGDDVSTPDMVKLIAEGMYRRPRLIPLPSSWLRMAAFLVRKEAVYMQLCHSLVIDPSKACHRLGWVPPVATADALVKAGREYLA